MTRFMRMAAILVWCMAAMAPGLACYAQGTGLFRGQTVYVPVYSHIYHGDKETPYYLAATVSIRNMDQSHSITVMEAKLL